MEKLYFTFLPFFLSLLLVRIEKQSGSDYCKHHQRRHHNRSCRPQETKRPKVISEGEVEEVEGVQAPETRDLFDLTFDMHGLNSLSLSSLVIV